MLQLKAESMKTESGQPVPVSLESQGEHKLFSIGTTEPFSGLRLML
jgi:hypothetical protein